jgi:squalene synthase HpnC
MLNENKALLIRPFREKPGVARGMSRPDEVSEPEGDSSLRAIAERAAEQASTENFSVALRVLPREPRERLMAVYRYARFVDDIGDEALGSAADRLRLLDRVENQVRRLSTPGANTDMLLRPVADMSAVVWDAGIPVQTLCDLIEANRIDQQVGEYETFDDLLHYCDYSAAPVGRMVLAIAGAATAPNMDDSDVVCAALQVLEHCQDLGEDARRGRVYLPQDALRRQHVPATDLTAATTSPALRAVVLDIVVTAERMLDSGVGLLRRLHGWARFAVAGYLAGGYETARALRRHSGEVLATPVTPGKAARAIRGIRLAAMPPASTARGNFRASTGTDR